jgi:hypothetical protein
MASGMADIRNIGAGSGITRKIAASIINVVFFMGLSGNGTRSAFCNSRAPVIEASHTERA